MRSGGAGEVVAPRGAGGAAGALARAVALVCEYPRHVLAIALAAGLALCAIDARMLFALAAVVVILLSAAGSPAHVAVAAAGLIVLGGGLGDARLSAIDADPLATAPPGAITLRGHVVASPRTGEHGLNLRIRAVWPRQLVQVRWRGELSVPLQIGQEVVARGRLAPVDPARARAGTARSYAEYLLRQGVRRQLTASEFVVTGARRGGAYGVVDAIRMRADAALARELPPEAAGLLRGMVLGGDAGLSEETTEQFRVVGLSHILAVSGQNVLLIVILVQAILVGLGARRRTRLIVPGLVIAIYVLLCGAQASVIRAGVMGLAALAALAASRPSSRIYALILAAIVLLAWNPRSTMDVGAQLSFAAVLGIMAFTGPVSAKLTSLPGWAAQAFAATFGATLATAPLMAFHFEAVSLISLLANVIGEPLIGPIVWLGSLTAAIAQISIPLASLLNAVTGFVLAALLELARVLSGVPGASAQVPHFGLVGLVVSSAFVVLAAAVANGWINLPGVGRGAPVPTAVRKPLVLAAAVLVLFAGWPILAGGERLRGPALVMLDVGQGDALLLVGRGCNLLIDTGPEEARVDKLLRARGVGRIDALLITHQHDDHSGGVAALERAGMLDSAARLEPERGTRFACPGIALELIGPAPRPPGVGLPEDLNELSAVAKIDLAGLRILAPGDAESPQLLGLPLGPVDVVKVSHHGSEDPGLPALLTRISPRLALIGVGAANRHGHPTPQSLSALEAAGVEVKRTDRDGTIVLGVGR